MRIEGLPASTCVEISTFFKGDIADDRIAAVHRLSVDDNSVNIGLAIGEFDAHDNLLAMCDDYDPQAMLGRLIPFKGDTAGYAGMVRAVRQGNNGSFYVQYGAMSDCRQGGAALH
ncbi:MAG: hypothetical protein Q4A37_01290 [Candidatus Saccharibacteria bacterium]|nr:hypothetical protein [Candidatus Saccharibacteria bacterium]